MPVVISNSSPIQYLHQMAVLDLLPALFGQVLVPKAVAAELEEGRRRKVPLPVMEQLPWLHVRTVRDRALLPLVTRLGDGEKEAIGLALELPNSLVLLDDRDARRHARAVGLDVAGTLGILLLAKEQNIIGAVRPLLDRLESLHFRLNARTRRIVLELAREEP